ncbi:cilia- and flagella-associated protein HOATZ isoform X3 [Pogona vitticeps]
MQRRARKITFFGGEGTTPPRIPPASPRCNPLPAKGTLSKRLGDSPPPPIFPDPPPPLPPDFPFFPIRWSRGPKAARPGPGLVAMATAREAASGPEAPGPQAVGPPGSGGLGSGGSLVFQGGEEQDVALAKTFWNSVTLQPPLESRLTGHRASSLPGGGGNNGGGGGGGSRRSSAVKNEPHSARPSVDKSKDERSLGATEAEKKDVKEQYLKKAKRREEIIALLRKQRAERILQDTDTRIGL